MDTGESFKLYHQNDLICSSCTSSKIIIAVLNQICFFDPELMRVVCLWVTGRTKYSRQLPDPAGNPNFPLSLNFNDLPVICGFTDEVSFVQAPANRAKGARVNVSKSELQQKSAYCTLSSQSLNFLACSFLSFKNVAALLLKSIKIWLLWLHCDHRR